MILKKERVTVNQESRLKEGLEISYRIFQDKLKKIFILSGSLLVLILILAFLKAGEVSGVNKPEQEGKAMADERRIVRLPQPKYDGPVSVEKALHQRRSIRSYKKAPLSLAEISQLLWAAQGRTGPRGFRTAPSAGALYPLEVYVVAGNVTGLPEGIYKYSPGGHEIFQIMTGDRRSELCRAGLGQSSIREAAATLVFSAVFERITGKYGERGIKYTYMEVGHAAQNAALEAVSLGLGTVFIGAFYDDEVKKVVRMPDNERPLYLMPVGRK